MPAMPALIRLISSDGVEFAVEPKIAKMSNKIASLMEVCCQPTLDLLE